MPSNLNPQKSFNCTNQYLTSALPVPVRYNSREQKSAKTLQTILPFTNDFGVHTVPKNIETTIPEIPCKMDLSNALGPCTEKTIPAQIQLSTILTKTHDFGQTSTDEQSAILGSTTPLNSSFSYPIK